MSKFMRPLEHSPVMAMHLLKPRQQSMLEQLGLNDDDLKHQTSSSDSDSEGQVLPTCSSIAESPIHSSSASSSENEMRELKHMLRVTQHKLHLAQCNLTECEHNRERKLKIMRKTHQSALALKQALIQELQDIIAEKDEIINTKMRNNQADEVTTKPSLSESQVCLQRLVEQLIHLQKEHSAMLENYENLSEELQLSMSERDRLQQKLVALRDRTLEPSLHVPSRSANNHLMEQMRDMQQKVTRLEIANRSHVDNEELQVQVAELKSQLNTEKERNDQEKKNVVKLQSQLCAMETKQKRLQEEWEKVNESKVILELANGSLKAELAKKDFEIGTLHTSLKDKISDLEHKLRMEEESAASSNKECGEVKMTLLLSKEKVRDLLRIINNLEKDNERKDVENRELRQQVQYLHTQLRKTPESELEDKIKSSLCKVSESVCCTRKLFTSVRELTVEYVKTLQWDMCSATQEISRKISAISQHNSKILMKYRREMALRKKLHNQLVDLKGNIRVLCRIRPPIAEDGTGSAATVVVKADAEDDGALSVLSHGSWRRFEMDKVFGPSSTQEQIFSEVNELVTSCTDGYNVCIFAYGQTGSGKTFTMEGVPDNPGINQRALLELFNIIKQRQLDWDFTVIVSVLEVYNESIRDLLAVNHTEKMDVKQGPDGVYVPGLTQVSVTCLEEVNEVFALGHENRSTGATKMNIYSSRSHALLCITVIGVSKSTGSQTIAYLSIARFSWYGTKYNGFVSKMIIILRRLNLIDLAGSERVAKSGSEGDRLQEAKHINKSLSALGDVIHSLKNKSTHIPYRNSKLTYLLQDSLGGNSKTLMVVQVAPVEKNLGESVCSLNFAQRVKAVELGQASNKVLA